MFMGETGSSPNVDAKQPTKEGNQEVTVEDRSFHPVELSPNEKKNVEERQICGPEAEEKLKNLLMKLCEETLQLSQFLSEENKLINEICSSLRQVLKKLNISVVIPSQEIPSRERLKKAVLTEKAELVINKENNEKRSAFLADYPPEVVIAVLWVIMPELPRVIAKHKRKIIARGSFLKKAKKEIAAATKAIADEGEEETSNEELQSNAGKEAPPSENKV
jgi:hypothetical protein